ncbi:unnamed protein product [Microthlaspi erraticum]|uniref:Uncharacterized protein n=1 Tax=Microthlaspi erraticum TaxID=1685480 RepID=A0A6D2IIU0_9BRAS|nr:unnamed protein product [Microthlaspi erraticum]
MLHQSRNKRGKSTLCKRVPSKKISQNGTKDRDHKSCKCLWNLPRPSEVDKIGFFAATLRPSRIASYTTLSDPEERKKKNENVRINRFQLNADSESERGKEETVPLAIGERRVKEGGSIHWCNIL